MTPWQINPFTYAGKTLALRKGFTMIEVVVAIAIFAIAVLALLTWRNDSLEKSHHAVQLLKAQEIIDEVMAQYRLYPFSEEPLALPRDYSPYEVNVAVNKESINIIPEEWRLQENPILMETDEDKKNKERIILRVTVSVGFSSLVGSDNTLQKYEVSSLIRHIELKDKLNTK